jgi:hypothetical protein
MLKILPTFLEEPVASYYSVEDFDCSVLYCAWKIIVRIPEGLQRNARPNLAWTTPVPRKVLHFSEATPVSISDFFRAVGNNLLHLWYASRPDKTASAQGLPTLHSVYVQYMIFKETTCRSREWIHLAQDGVQWRAVGNVVMNLMGCIQSEGIRCVGEISGSHGGE